MRVSSALRSWTRALLHRSRSESEMDAELRSHIAAYANDLIRNGVPEQDAMRRARMEFGGIEFVKEECRDARRVNLTQDVIQDLRYGLRTLRKSPGFTTVALLTLAFAIGANTAIFSVVNAVLIRSTPYKEPDRIAVIWGTNSLTNTLELNTSLPNFEDWRRRSRTFEHLAGYRESDAAFAVNGEPDWIEFAWVYGDFFELLGRSPLLGRTFGNDEPDPHTVVLSHRLWKSRFGGLRDVIGQTVTVSGVNFQVIGVMPEDFSFPLGETGLWAPAAALPNWQSIRATRRGGFFSVAGRLHPGVTLQQARAEMATISHQLEAAYPVENQFKSVNIVPLAVQINGTSIPFMLMVLFGAVVFVLLIASANVANLLLARGAARAQEFAVRMAIGAGRTRLLRQLLTESVLLSGAAGILALPIAAWSIRALIAIAPQKLERLGEARIDAGVLGFGLILSLATGIIFGLIPAIRISRDAGRRSHTTGVHARGLRRSFVVAEVALAVVLVTGAGLLIRSFAALQSVDPGFQTERVIAATLRFRNDIPRDRRFALYQEAMTRLAQIPGVSAVGSVSTMFFSGERNKFGLRAVEGKPEEKQTDWTEMTWATVSGDYFQALGIPLLRGRFFSEGDTGDKSPVVIINQMMAHRYWPNEDPIGKGLKGFDARGHNDEWVRVIGVVGDMRSNGLEREPMAQLYETQAQSHDETEDVVIRTSASASVLRDAVRSVDKTAVLLNVSTLEGRLRAQTAPRKFQMLLVSVFAGLALTLAASGIFGMMHFAVAQRTREIGIRMAMGARPANVVGMVLREGFLLTAVGTAIGLVGSFSLARSMRSLLFEVSPADPMTMCAVASGLGLVALLACYLPAHHATRIDPMLALRSE